MNVQDAANWTIPEGGVRNLHDKNKRLLWSAVGYDVKYKGDTTQQTYSGKNLSPTLNNYTWYGYHTGGLTVTNSSVTAITSPEYSSTGVYISKSEFPSICPALGQTGNVVSCTISLDIASDVRIGYEGTTSGTFVKDSLPAGKTRVSFATKEAVNSISFYVTNRTGATIVISEFQVEAGSTATSYEPYVGGVPAPNPDYPQDVNVVKGTQNVIVSAKNLLSVSFAAVGGVPYDIPTNTFILDRVDQRFFRCDFPTLLPPGTYTISFDVSDNNTAAGINFTLFNRLESAILNVTQISRGSTSSHYSGTFTVSEDIKIIRWFIASNESNDKHATISNVQIEAGSTATAYEMYQGQQTFPVGLIGKNLFDKDGNITANSWLRNDGSSTSSTDGWSVTDYIPILPNTSYATSGMEFGSGVNPSRCYYDKDKNFISGIKHNNANPFIDTAPANAYYLKDSFKTDDVNTLQIELGTSATPYVPYYNYELCKIGNYQDYIFKSSGKNLFDGVLEVGIINGITGLDQANSNYVRAEDYIPVEELTYYRISTDNTNISSVFVYEYKADKTYNLATNKSLTLTDVYRTEEGTAFIRFRPNYQTTDTSIKFQVEKGTVVTPYEPYGTDWYVHKEVYGTILNGSENITEYSIKNSILGVRVPVEYNALHNVLPKSNYFYGVLFADFYSEDTRKYGTVSTHNSSDVQIIYMTVPNSLVTTVNELESWLSTHNTKVYYVLATPTYTKITDATLIGQLNAVHDWLRRYDYYGVVSGNLPIIINRSGII